MYHCTIVNIYVIHSPSEVEPEQTGPLITPAILPSLSPQQTQNLAMAKKYCADVTTKFVSQCVVLYQYTSNQRIV